jgi:hypothetical protein
VAAAASTVTASVIITSAITATFTAAIAVGEKHVLQIGLLLLGLVLAWWNLASVRRFS